MTKTDGSGEPLKGAKLRITCNGQVVAEWVSDGSVHEVKLADGDYTLSEVEAPAGYKKAADQHFTVKASEHVDSAIRFHIEGSTKGMFEKKLVGDDNKAIIEPIYCFNLHKRGPSVGSEYLKQEGSENLFASTAQTPREKSTLYQDVLRVIYNGYRKENGQTVDKAGIQARFHLSDEGFYWATQAAIWYYTDSEDLNTSRRVYENEREAAIALVQSADQTPEGQTLNIYQPRWKNFERELEGFQSLLTTDFHAPQGIDLKVVDEKQPTTPPTTPPSTTPPTTPPSTPPATPGRPTPPTPVTPDKPTPSKPVKPSQPSKPSAPRTPVAHQKPALAKTGSDVTLISLSSAIVFVLGAALVMWRMRAASMRS
ncbi:Cys-Gln thioester bond-forming surface protein [Parascardovia denticolens]